MIIEVKVKNVYGSERIYPITQPDTFYKLTGQLTLSDRHIKALKALGHEFKNVTEVKL